jgi:hypothetical protein
MLKIRDIWLVVAAMALLLAWGNVNGDPALTVLELLICLVTLCIYLGDRRQIRSLLRFMIVAVLWALAVGPRMAELLPDSNMMLVANLFCGAAVGWAFND